MHERQMKNNHQDGHDPHHEFMEWVAAVASCSSEDHLSPAPDKASEKEHENIPAK
jgi:hypothetical protein